MNAGGNSKKIGRAKRTPSNAGQKLRTDANKRRRLKKLTELLARKEEGGKKMMRTPRGTARAVRRAADFTATV